MFENKFTFALKREKKRVLKVELARIDVNLHSGPVKVPVVSYCLSLGRESLGTGRKGRTKEGERCLLFTSLLPVNLDDRTYLAEGRLGTSKILN